jgi:hypothetical protein
MGINRMTSIYNFNNFDDQKHIVNYTFCNGHFYTHDERSRSQLRSSMKFNKISRRIRYSFYMTEDVKDGKKIIKCERIMISSIFASSFYTLTKLNLIQTQTHTQTININSKYHYPIMKFSTIVLALSAIVAPSAAEYVCHSDAFFTFDTDSTPSGAAQKFLGSALVDAFNDAYASVDGITMDGDDIEDVSNNILLRYVVSDCCCCCC